MGVGEIDFVNIWRRPTSLTYAVTIRRLLLRTLQWLLASLWVRFKVLTHLTTIPFILQPLQCPSPAARPFAVITLALFLLRVPVSSLRTFALLIPLPGVMFCQIPSCSAVVVQLLSRVWLFATPWTPACQASSSTTNSRSLLKLKSIESVMPSNQLILCCPVFLLPSIFSSVRVFSTNSSQQVAKVLELQLQRQSFQWIFRVYFL